MLTNCVKTYKFYNPQGWELEVSVTDDKLRLRIDQNIVILDEEMTKKFFELKYELLGAY